MDKFYKKLSTLNVINYVNELQELINYESEKTQSNIDWLIFLKTYKNALTGVYVCFEMFFKAIINYQIAKDDANTLYKKYKNECANDRLINNCISDILNNEYITDDVLKVLADELEFLKCVVNGWIKKQP